MSVMEKEETDKGEEIYSSDDIVKVVRFNNLVVKSGRKIKMIKPQNLRFVAANTTIPVPKVHEIFLGG